MSVHKGRLHGEFQENLVVNQTPLRAFFPRTPPTVNSASHSNLYLIGQLQRKPSQISCQIDVKKTSQTKGWYTRGN